MFFFVFFPVGTDAPVYYRPWATVGLIVLNVLVFFAPGFLASEPDADADRGTIEQVDPQRAGQLVPGMARPADNGASDDDDDDEPEVEKPDPLKPWALSHGLGLHPVQWVTSNFLHGNIGHLIGNMIFLWVFGIIVEGKLGWWRFLMLYLGLGVVQCASEQIVTLGRTEAYSLGASAIIFGLLAMSLIWAPKNDLNCIWVAGLGFRVRTGDLDLTILAFAAIYIFMEAITVLLSGFALSSSILHMTGALWGSAAGVLLLKANWVDCENWDLFAVMEHRVGKSKPKQPRPESDDVVDGTRSIAAKSAAALEKMRQAIEGGYTDIALAIYKNTKWALGGEPTEADLVALIKLLHDEKRFGDSVPLMAKFVSRFPDKAPRMRLKLAQVLIREQRPLQALRALGAIAPNSLPRDLEQVKQQFERKATQMREEGVVELEGEDW